MSIVNATDLARQCRTILDKVVNHGETVKVMRNRTMVAKIIPSECTMTAAQALAGLTFPLLTPLQANTWLKESKRQFEETVRDPWE